jgi:hypothetical protein
MALEGKTLRMRKKNDCGINYQSDTWQTFQNEGEPKECPFLK